MPDTELTEKINDFFEREAWSGARALLNKELKKTPDSHWLLARLSTTYYEQRRYDKALEITRQAERLAPTVRWCSGTWLGPSI
jgi:tetratricopeptide (TPR) repeat protein